MLRNARLESAGRGYRTGKLRAAEGMIELGAAGERHDDVPAPTVGSKSVLVLVAYSCISVGTETAGVRLPPHSFL